MILAAATEGGGSQYFYLAPKMPYGLEYKPGTVRGTLFYQNCKVKFKDVLTVDRFDTKAMLSNSISRCISKYGQYLS